MASQNVADPTTPLNHEPATVPAPAQAVAEYTASIPRIRKSPPPTPFPVFLGWDNRQAEPAEVARFSLLANASVPLLLKQLIDSLAIKPDDPRASAVAEAARATPRKVSGPRVPATASIVDVKPYRPASLNKSRRIRGVYLP